MLISLFTCSHLPELLWSKWNQRRIMLLIPSTLSSLFHLSCLSKAGLWVSDGLWVRTEVVWAKGKASDVLKNNGIELYPSILNPLPSSFQSPFSSLSHLVSLLSLSSFTYSSFCSDSCCAYFSCCCLSCFCPSCSFNSSSSMTYSTMSSTTMPSYTI